MGNFIKFFHQIVVHCFALFFQFPIVNLFKHDGVSILVTFLHRLQEWMDLSIVKFSLLDGSVIP